MVVPVRGHMSFMDVEKRLIVGKKGIASQHLIFLPALKGDRSFPYGKMSQSPFLIEIGGCPQKLHFF